MAAAAVRLGSRARRMARVAVLALAMVVLAAQVVWARGAVCVAARDAHAACKCCEERARSAETAPVIAADCCAVEEAPPGATAGGGAAAVVRDGAGAMAAVLPAVVMASRVGRGVVGRGEPVVVEARCAGPPLWLRLQTLRL